MPEERQHHASGLLSPAEIAIDPKTIKSCLFLHDSGNEIWWRCSVKWDGCVNLTVYFCEPEGHEDTQEDSMHVCDLSEFIARLQAIEKKAKEHYGDNWPLI